MLRQSEAVAKKVDTAVAAVCEHIETRLVQAWDRAKESENDEDVLAVGALLLRAAKMYQWLDLSGRATINQVAATLIDDSRTNHLAAEATVPAVMTILGCLSWQLRGYTPGSGDAPQLKIRTRAFTEQLVLLLDHPSGEVKFAVCIGRLGGKVATCIHACARYSHAGVRGLDGCVAAVCDEAGNNRV